MSNMEAYLTLAASYPDLFHNPEGAAFEILLDQDDIGQAEQQAAARLRARGEPEAWAEVGIVYQDQYLYILRDAVRYVDQSMGTYIRALVSAGGPVGVAIFPMRGDDVLLIRHFRHATRQWHLEVPRGGADGGPDMTDNARRELAEEIGADIGELISLGGFYPDTGMANGAVELFLARVTTYGIPEAIEGISQIVPTPLEELERLIATDEITDGFTLACYARAKTRKLI
jgi:ADP-ribose pyrophosphatase